MASSQPAAKKLDEEIGDDLFETVDWSCCCCSRRTGMLILGVSFFCLSLVALVLCAVGTVTLMKPPEVLMRYVTTSEGPKMQPHPLIEDLDGTLRTELLIREGMIIMMNIQSALCGMGMITALLLLWGTWTKKAVPLLPWIINSCAEILFLVGAAIYSFSVGMSVKLPLLDMDGFFALVFMFLFCLPVGYCILAVATFYRELKGVKYDRFIPPPKTPEGGTELSRATTPNRSETPTLPPDNPTSNAAPGLIPNGNDNPAFENTAL